MSLFVYFSPFLICGRRRRLVWFLIALLITLVNDEWMLGVFLLLDFITTKTDEEVLVVVLKLFFNSCFLELSFLALPLPLPLSSYLFNAMLLLLLAVFLPESISRI